MNYNQEKPHWRVKGYVGYKSKTYGFTADTAEQAMQMFVSHFKALFPDKAVVAKTAEIDPFETWVLD